MKPNDLKIECIGPKNKGGQHAGLPKMDVKITHLPTGMIAQCGFERSQLKNKTIAMAMLEFGLLEIGWVD